MSILKDINGIELDVGDGIVYTSNNILRTGVILGIEYRNDYPSTIIVQGDHTSKPGNFSAYNVSRRMLKITEELIR